MSSEHEAIKAWRDTFKLNLKLGFKQDILLTVINLESWKALLSEWKAKKWNPLSIKEQLSEYERRESQTKRSDAALRPGKSEDCTTISQAGIPERLDRGVSCVREGPGLHARRDNQTLEEVLTNALRQTNRA